MSYPSKTSWLTGLSTGQLWFSARYQRAYSVAGRRASTVVCHTCRGTPKTAYKGMQRAPKRCLDTSKYFRSVWSEIKTARSASQACQSDGLYLKAWDGPGPGLFQNFDIRILGDFPLLSRAGREREREREREKRERERERDGE